MSDLTLASFAEMMIHPALCVHPQPLSLLIVGEEGDRIAKECDKYTPSLAAVVHKDKSVLAHLAEGSFDIIVIADDQPLTSQDSAYLHRLLTSAGIALVSATPYEKRLEDLKNELLAASLFRIAMPYRFDGGMALFISKLYHPLADLVLQKVDMTDGYTYYNAEVHNAAFALPTLVRQTLLGYAKN